MTLGRRLHALRSNTGLSLRQVAVESGVSPSTLSRAERDKGAIDTLPLSKLAAFYGVSLEDLLGDTGRIPEMSDEEVNFFLIGRGYNLEQLRVEINALIDELRAEALATWAQKDKTP